MQMSTIAMQTHAGSGMRDNAHIMRRLRRRTIIAYRLLPPTIYLSRICEIRPIKRDKAAV